MTGDQNGQAARRGWVGRLFPGRLDRRDMGFTAALWGIALLFLAAVFGLALFLTPQGRVFTGSIHDTCTALSYQAWSTYFARQGLLADNPAALTRQPPAFFNLVWFIMGRLTALGLPFLPLYYLFRAVATGLMLLAMSLLMRHLFRDRTMAWAATILAAFGTGFGWIAGIVNIVRPGRMPLGVDLTLGDAFPINTMWTFPHLTLAHALVLAVFYLAFRSFTGEGRRAAWLAAGVILLLGFTHPYQLVTIAAVLIGWYLTLRIKRGKASRASLTDLGIMLGTMVPGTAYYWWLIHYAPNFTSWEGLNKSPSGDFLAFVIGFGPLLLLAALGYRGVTPLSLFSDEYLLVCVWAAISASLLLSYPLLFFAGKLDIGIVYPLAVLATRGFYGSLVPFFRRGGADRPPEADILGEDLGEASLPAAPAPGRLRWAVLLTILCLPTTFFHLANSYRMHRSGDPYVPMTLNNWSSIPREELEGMRFLAGRVRDFPLVMTGMSSGVMLPAYAAVRTFLGQSTQTADYARRGQIVARFYTSKDWLSNRDILKYNDVDYIWWSKDEDLMLGSRPPDVSYLRTVFRKGPLTIYQVDRGAL